MGQSLDLEMSLLAALGIDLDAMDRHGALLCADRQEMCDGNYAVGRREKVMLSKQGKCCCQSRGFKVLSKQGI